MRLFAIILAVTTFGGALFGCAYGAVATAGDKVVITRNGFLGFSRKVYVCKVTDHGATGCQDAENP